MLYNCPMPTPILATKLYIPLPRSKIVLRPRLIERLNENCKLTLISAPAGFGKTTLVGEWLYRKDEGGGMKDESGQALHPSAFISLDGRDVPLPRWPGCRWTKGIATSRAF